MHAINGLIYSSTRSLPPRKVQLPSLALAYACASNAPAPPRAVSVSLLRPSLAPNGACGEPCPPAHVQTHQTLREPPPSPAPLASPVTSSSPRRVPSLLRTPQWRYFFVVFEIFVHCCLSFVSSAAIGGFPWKQTRLRWPRNRAPWGSGKTRRG